MTVLLDVNALLALGYRDHVHHERVGHWFRSLSKSDQLATCAITELGFIRIATSSARYSESVAAAQAALLGLKAASNYRFLPDALTAECLPDWVLKSKQTTDGHLVELALAHGARLATLDAGIPSAVLIPEWPVLSEVRESEASYGVAA
jgi:toxin-antitoxin system PIN domain toxin